MLHRGIPVSPGVVVAPAFCLEDTKGLSDSPDLSVDDVSLELAQFNQACEDAASELRSLIEKVSTEIGPRESSIFQAHLFMVRDRSFHSKVRSLIVDGRHSAARALNLVLGEYEQLFGSIEDEYLRERIVDLRDVVHRIREHLSEKKGVQLNFAEPVILVAHELYPSQSVGLGKLKIQGIVTERGGGTSHAAIIARSLGIPSVSGVEGVLQHVRTGNIIALDGRDGHILVNPGPEAEAAYRKLQREFFHFKDHLIENRDQPAVSRDGESILLLANVNSVADAKAAVDVGAAGVGLFRTEYLFMTHPSIPDEEEQVNAYRQVLNASPNRILTIRTLDLGGDKTVPYLGDHRESNPFMGWRSIRLSFEHPEFFRKQIRAILRAGAEGDVRMMFPMITTAEELRLARQIVRHARQQLQEEGLQYGDVRVGFMLEVPAAALCIDQLLRHADFVSIGTNDMIQYLMAADRDNPKVAHLCDPLNPAVLRLLRSAIEACNAHSVPVTVCGEMAGRPRCVLALLAFGLRCFSMSPAFVPIIKELLHSVDLRELASRADAIVNKPSSRQVRKMLDTVLRSVNPRLAELQFN